VIRGYAALFSGKLSLVNSNQSVQLPAGAPNAAAGEPTEPGSPDPVLLKSPQSASREVGGRDGPDPTRYGDWELRGRCIDF
jgi:hypothetical protein